MSVSFSDRVAVITGAGSGLGKAYAIELAQRGAKVVVNDLDEGNARTVARQIAAAGGTAIASCESVATRAGGTAIIDSALDAFGRIDILVSNAGILRQARFEEMSDADIDAVINVHLKGAFHVGQPAFAAMKRQSYGRILFTASSSGLFGHPWQASYGAAKAGIAGLSNVVSLEGKDHGILSNVIMPNALTNMNRKMDLPWLPEFNDISDILTRLSAMPPADGDRLDPRWVVPLATYLVSEQCQSSQGIYSACSGRYARVFIGAAEGWPASDLPDADDIAAHWDEICDPSHFSEPKHVYDEAIAVREALISHAQSPPRSTS